MVGTNVKSDCKRLNKDTRWDRIRKKYTSTPSIKSNVVKRLVEMDFIGKDNVRLLNGEVDFERNLDPTLVMDLRHEMFQKSKPKPASSIKKYIPHTEKCIVHNIKVEEHYIQNELSKLKSQLAKNRKSITIKPKPPKPDVHKLNNKNILKSLENTSRHIKDFYQCPARAIELISNDRDKDESKLEEPPDKVIDNQDQTVLSPKSSKNDNSCTAKPRIRFDDNVETLKYKRDHSVSSNSNYSSDSEISNLADEAVEEATSKSKFTTSIEVGGSSLHKEGVDPLIVTKIAPEQVSRTEDTTTSSNSCDESSDNSSSNEQNAIIDQLFEMKDHLNMAILKKHFMKWIHFTTIQKIERENITNKSDRIHKINAFLDHIREKKKNPTPQPKEVSSRQLAQAKMLANNNVRKYQSKIKLQQDIIDLQKMKLERQERLITELKLSKISEEAKEVRQNIKTELKNVFRSGDFNVRAKAKCLQIMGNLRDKEDGDDFARLQGKSLMQPKFLLNMQERALMRSVKHDQAKQRRLQKESEREAAKLAMEEAKRLEDEQAKMMRIELLKEKRRQEKMAKILKERERQRAIENTKKSQDFCRKYLLRRVGMEAFRRLLDRKRSNQKKSDALQKRLYEKNAFLAWKDLYLQKRQQKIDLVDSVYEKNIKRHAIQAWLEYMKEERSKYHVAVDWYELKLNQFVFTHWSGYTKLQKIIEDMKTKQAESHHEWHLKWKVLDRWQRLPQVIKLEKETDERRQRWRMKIWELLPDYTPNRDEDTL